jgi:branched-chain amino acid transport system permease protein
MTNPTGTFARSYAEDTAVIRTRLQWILAVAALALFYLLPLFSNAFLIQWLCYALILMVGTVGINLLVGYTGQLSLAQAGFVAVGAFTTGLLSTKLNMPFWLAIPVSGVTAGIVGMVFGLPSLRIRGLYLMMATLAAQALIMYVLSHAQIFGSGLGISGIHKAELFGITFSSGTFYYVILTVAILSIIVALNIVRSRIGRAFIAIRDNDIAAEMMGVNLFRYKMLAFFLGCFFGGVAGSLLAYWNGAVSPEQFTLMDSFWYVGFLLVGGMGTTLGPILGVICLQGISESINLLVTSTSTIYPSLIYAVGPMRAIVFGLILILFLKFEPRGLNHAWQIVKASYRRWPVSF